MVERVAPGDAGEVEEEETQTDVDSSDSETTTETATETSTDRPQMQAPRDFGSTSSADSESGGTESSSTSEETATAQSQDLTATGGGESQTMPPDRDVADSTEVATAEAADPVGTPTRETAPTPAPDVVGPRGEEGQLEEQTDFAHRELDSVDSNQGVEGGGGRVGEAASDVEQDALDALSWTDDPRDVRVTSEEQPDGSIQLTTELTERGEARFAQDRRQQIVEETEGIDHVGDITIDRTDTGMDFSLSKTGERNFNEFFSRAHGGDDASGVTPAPGGEPGKIMPDEEFMRTAARPGVLDSEGGNLEKPDTARETSMLNQLEADFEERQKSQAFTQADRDLIEAEMDERSGSTVDQKEDTGAGGARNDLGDSLWAASPVGALVASKVGSGDKVGSSKMAGDIGLGDITSDPSGSLDAIQRGGEFLPSTWNFGQRDVREMTGSHLVINEDAGSGDFDSLAVGNVPMETSIEVGGDERQLPISTTAPGPFGAGLAGARGASRASAQLLRSKKPWELSRTARTGPVGGQQVAEGVAKYGKFAPEGAEKIVASTVAATPFAAAEINTPTTREEFAQEEVGVPEDRSDFVQEEIAAPEQSDFSRAEVGVPEETETFSELDAPSNLGGRTSDSVVINRDGDVSVILSAQQMFRDPKQDEDDLLDVPDEFLPEDDVVIGEREDDINTFDQPTGDELAEQVEEQEVDWKQHQQRDILSDESTQTDTLGDLTEESVGDSFLPGQETQSVASPSVGTGTSVGGLLDEETTTDVDAQPGVDLDDRTGLDVDVGQSPMTDQGLGVDTDLGLGNLFETGVETATDTGPGFGNPNEQEFPHEFGYGQSGGMSNGPPGASLGLGLPAPDPKSESQSSSRGMFETQYEFDLPDAEDVLFGSDKKKKKKGGDDFFGDVGDFDGGLDIGDPGQGFGSLDDF